MNPEPKTPLPDLSEKALLHLLTNKVEHGLSFKKVCDQRRDVFGERSSQLRRKVQKRRAYLIQNPDILNEAVRKTFGDRYVYKASSPERTTSAAVISSPPLVSPPPRTIVSPPPIAMSTPSKKGSYKDPEDLKEVQMYFDSDFYKNENGLFVILGKEVVEDNTVMDRLTVLKPIWDLIDFDRGRYKARLTNDCGGIIIQEPIFASWMWNNPRKVMDLIDAEEEEACARTELAYKTMKTRVNEKREYRIKETLYRFPEGITCNTDHFNKKNRGSSSLLLDCNIHIFEHTVGKTDENRDIIMYCPFVCWKMAVDGEGRRTAEDDEEVTATAAALSRIGFTLSGTRSATGLGNNDDDMNDDA